MDPLGNQLANWRLVMCHTRFEIDLQAVAISAVVA